MPDENGTETTRSVAPSANDVLFGGTTEEQAAAPEDTDANERDAKDANGEAEQGAQDAADAGDKADAAETGAEDDLKVVVVIKGDRATIGVKGTSSDPHIETFDDTGLSGLAQEVPAVVERARARWEEAPKHPAYERPAPPAKRRSRRQQESAAQDTNAEEAEQAQPEAPRLF